MPATNSSYFQDFIDQFGQAWNRFWFRPSDPFSLGLLRLLIGTLATIWYAGLGFSWLSTFGPEGGLMDSGEIYFKWRGEHGFSILDYAKDESTLMLVFWLGLLVIITFTLGFWSSRNGWLDRIGAALTLLVVVSVLQRMPMLTNLFADVLPMLLLYLCIGPNSAECSFGAWKRNLELRRRPSAAFKAPIAGDYSTTIALRLLQLHIAVVYLMMAAAQLRTNSWWQGTALEWLAANPETRLFKLDFLSSYLFNIWTHCFLLFEILFPILIWNRLARPLLLAFSVLMWVGMAMISGQVLTCLLMIAIGVVYISPAWLRAKFCSGGSTQPAAAA